MNAFEKDKTYILNTYKRLPHLVKKHRDNLLEMVSGEFFLDFFSGITVNSVGYSSEIVSSMKQKMEHYLHLSNYFVDEDRTELARLLLNHAFSGKVFFTNSGTEANEAAFKLIKKHKPGGRILTAKNSFHGRTLGALSLTGRELYKKAFEPLLDVVHFEFNDVASLLERVDENTAAIMIEPILGEGGVIPLEASFAEALQKICDEENILLVVDEIQTGIYRTGSFFAYEQFGLNPDIITVAKSLGAGLPLGAMIVREEYAHVLSYGDHGSTFGGNPVACAGGRKLIEILSEDGFRVQFKEKALRLMKELRVLQDIYPSILDVRGLGFMIGIETKHAETIKSTLAQKGILINTTRGDVIRLIPPLTVNDEELDVFISAFQESLEELPCIRE